jgi:hypothetical protein
VLIHELRMTPLAWEHWGWRSNVSMSSVSSRPASVDIEAMRRRHPDSRVP